jgi:hypothetical protein
MPEQPQWSERTLDMPPQDPWAEHPTAPGHPAPGQQQPGAPGQHQPTTPISGYNPFTQGRAQVNAQPQNTRRYADHDPTGVGWPGAEVPSEHRGMSWRWSELRRGSEWTTAAVLFAFVCWGVWALSGGGSLGTPLIVFAVTLAVAVGVFCLARVVGYVVLERQFGRQRRTARGSHLVTALFLAGVGVADLQQTQWVMDAVHWVTDHI